MQSNEKTPTKLIVSSVEMSENSIRVEIAAFCMFVRGQEEIISYKHVSLCNLLSPTKEQMCRVDYFRVYMIYTHAHTSLQHNIPHIGNTGAVLQKCLELEHYNC